MGELGTIEKGKLADSVLSGADPLQDIANTQKIETVTSHEVIDRVGRRGEELRKIWSKTNRDRPRSSGPSSVAVTL